MFITDFMQQLDTLLQTYAFDAYHALVGQHATSIGLVVMLYFIFLGYRFLMAQARMDAGSLLEHMLLVSCCYFLATNWSVFSLFIYDLAMSIPDAVASSLVSVVPGVPTQSDEVALLEYLWYSGLEVAGTLWAAISITAIHQGLLALGVLVMTLLLVGYGLLVISLAKMIMAIGFALAPLFILLYMFKRSQRIAMGWLSVLVTAMAKQIIIFAMIALVYSLAFQTVESLIALEQLAMLDVATFLLLLFISFGLFLSTNSIARTLGKSTYMSAQQFAEPLQAYMHQHWHHVTQHIIEPHRAELTQVYSRLRHRATQYTSKHS